MCIVQIGLNVRLAYECSLEYWSTMSRLVRCFLMNIGAALSCIAMLSRIGPGVIPLSDLHQHFNVCVVLWHLCSTYSAHTVEGVRTRVG